MRVLIIGAGVGGLATARALLPDGHDVAVFEQAAGPRGGGAAVTLWSNGSGILGELGVCIDDAGAPIEVLEQRDYRDRLLARVDVGQSAAHYGKRNICLPRRRLLDRLADCLPDGAVRYGRSCARVGQDSGGVLAEFADGSRESADLLVGADGRHSVVRGAVWASDPAQPSGWATWQGVTPIPVEIASSRRGVMFTGPAGVCGLMPAGSGLLQWWFDQRWTPASPAPASPVAALREHFGGWAAAPVRQVLAAVTDADAGFFPHYRHAVPATWGTGRITLVGDAAHSMPPTRAQGANQALEDAWALAAALRRDGDVPSALRSYERTRAPRVGLVARQSGKEFSNEYHPLMVRLLPDRLVAGYYTRWLGRISNYLN